MRDYITIRQKAFYEFLTNYNKDKPKKEQIKLDYKDLVIFEYIAQFCLSDNEKIKQNRIVIDEKEYTHIAYKKIIEDNPFLDFNTINPSKILANRLNKLYKLNLLDKYFAKENGNKTYFTLLPQGYTLITSGLEGVLPEGYKAYNHKVRRDITSGLDNSNINIDSKKIDNKNSVSPIYIGSLTTFFEKQLLRVISNLRDLFERYNLPAYKEIEYFNTINRLFEEGYEEDLVLLAIYARVEKVFTEEVDKFKFLETLSNPKYFYKSIDQLILEANSKVKSLAELYEKTQDEVKDELAFNFLKHCYPDYSNLEFEGKIDNNGHFYDKKGRPYYIEDIEYHIYLLYKLLSWYEIKLSEGFRYFIISNSVEKIPYEELMKRLLIGAIKAIVNKDIQSLKYYSSIKELVNYYNGVLNKQDIDLDLDEVVVNLEEQIEIEK
jgi:hypothetical protein